MLQARLLPVLGLLLVTYAGGADDEFFEKQIRPILAENCFECHGPKKQKAGLRLDSRDGMLRGGEGGAVLVPSDAEASRMIRAIRYDDPDLQMPPRSRLPEETIAALTEWVAMGAVWPNHDVAPEPGDGEAKKEFDLEARQREHWAWQPVARADPPDVRNAEWPRNDVDRFILARLENEGMTPAGDARREGLVRRASFDLTGLPPKPDEIRAFLEDNSVHAWEKVIDRLLASPAYGERWGRHWLDLMRYAESYGHEQDFPIAEAWRYRDYVIRAFNADVPYDQFVTEHIAGDLMENPRLNPIAGFNESVMGTAFWFLGQATHAPVDSLQDEADRLDNQVDVFSKAFLGLTVSCARCHDHKFDAISTKDYHALWGYLKSSRRQFYELDPSGNVAATARELRTMRAAADNLLRGEMRAHGGGLNPRIAEYMLAAREVVSGRAPSMMSVAVAQDLDPALFENWIHELDSGDLDDPGHPLHAWRKLAWSHEPAETATFDDGLGAWLDEEKAREVRGGLFADFNGGDYSGWTVSGEAFGVAPSGPAEWSAVTGRAVPAGVAHSGREARRLRGVLRSRTFIIEKPEIHYRMAGEGAIVRLVVDGYTMRDHHDLLFADMRMEVNTEGQYRWIRQVKDVGRYIGHRAHIEIEDPGDGYAAVNEIRFADAEPAAGAGNSVSKLLAALHGDGAWNSADGLARACEGLALRSFKRWGEPENPGRPLADWLVERGLVARSEQAAEISAVKESMDRAGAQLPDPVRALAMMDGTPEESAVYIRGSAKTPGEVVPRRFLEAISGLEGSVGSEGSGRLGLARQLLDPSDPLPARVMVNRIWSHLFGRGIVATPDNFGALGEKPSHPELLDYLATRFRDEGWSVKRMIRFLMTSRAYQMQSEAVIAANEEKDPADVLLHRMRMRRLEGEAIRDSLLAVSGALDPKMGGEPVQVFMTPFMEGRNPPVSGPLDGAGRRSVYLAVRRNFLSPMLLAFDLPIPDSTVGRRNVSNLPAQALILMNDPFVRGQAERWAARACAESKDPRARIETMYEQALGRAPAAGEIYSALVFLNAQRREWTNAGDGADAVANSWSDLAHVIFMMKEFIFIS